MDALIINKATKKDLAKLMDYAKEIGLDVQILSKNTEASTLTSDEKKLRTMLESGIKEAKEIQQGKKEGKSLQQVLDEL